MKTQPTQPTQPTHPRSLREIEQEVEAEGREWTRQRLQQRLQEEADRHGEVSPLSGRRLVHRRTRAMQLRTAVGVVKLQVLHGQDPADEHWGCPVREHWGLTCHQQLSLALADKLAFTLTATASYEEASALAQKWGSPVTGSALHALAQRWGARAQARRPAQLQTAPVERQPERAPTKLAVLMLAGWQVRQRGPGWGKKKTPEARVEWHEWKTGVYYRHEQAGRTAGGRGVLAEKIVLGWQGEPLEFGRRLHWEALRAGLGRAQAKLVVADGAPWIWNVAQDRWAGATEVLDFYHASQPLWELGRALHGDDETAVAQWVEPRRHQLRHGREKQVLAEIAGLKSAARRGRRGGATRTELFCHARRTSELPEDPATWLADWIRTGGVGVPATTVPLQTARPVLDAQRNAPPQCADRSPPQSSLG